MRVSLVGVSCVGTTAAGRLLADRRGWPFFDLDEEIERHFGVSIERLQAGAAMNRNSVIIGLSLGLVVIEAGETGGTLAAGVQALNERRPVIALEFRKDMPAGNKILLDHGAIPARSREQLRDRLRQLLADNHPSQPTLV